MNVKRISSAWVIVLTAVSVLFSSCQDVININLKNAAPQLVIEGSIDNLSDTVTVLLHRSTDYYEPTTIQSVNDATVALSDSSGNVYNFLRVNDGVYVVANIHGKPGGSFSLKVSEGNTTCTAEAKMPGLVRIDRLYLDKESDNPHEDRLNIQIMDPKGVDNYYQVEVFVNDTLLTTGERLLIYSDKFFDGTLSTINIGGRRLGIDQFHSGDRIRVRLKNIDKSMYNYYDVLRSITNTMEILSVSSPSNPPNNISGGALGYFAAWSISESMIIKM